MTKAPDGEWWVRVAHSLASHVRQETAVLGDYEQLVGRTEDEGMRYVLDLILADERRHHDIFERLAAAARRDGPSLPAPSSPASHKAELLAATQRLVEIERADERGLRQLRRDLRPVAGDTMWHLLVDTMRLDTQKHVRLLGYLVRRLETSVPSGRGAAHEGGATCS